MNEEIKTCMTWGRTLEIIYVANKDGPKWPMVFYGSIKSICLISQNKLSEVIQWNMLVEFLGD